jgi:hypothetical protein
MLLNSVMSQLDPGNGGGGAAASRDPLPLATPRAEYGFATSSLRGRFVGVCGGWTLAAYCAPAWRLKAALRSPWNLVSAGDLGTGTSVPGIGAPCALEAAMPAADPSGLSSELMLKASICVGGRWPTKRSALQHCSLQKTKSSPSIQGSRSRPRHCNTTKRLVHGARRPLTPDPGPRQDHGSRGEDRGEAARPSRAAAGPRHEHKRQARGRGKNHGSRGEDRGGAARPSRAATGPRHEHKRQDRPRPKGPRSPGGGKGSPGARKRSPLGALSSRI